MALDKKTSRKRKNVKSDTNSKGKANGSTKKAKAKGSEGSPWWQVLLGLILVCAAAVTSAIALGVITVDDITENPLWIQTRDMVNEAIGREHQTKPPVVPREEGQGTPPPPPDKIKDTPPIEQTPAPQEAKTTPPAEKVKGTPVPNEVRESPVQQNTEATPPPKSKEVPPPLKTKEAPPPQKTKSAPPPPPQKTRSASQDTDEATPQKEGKQPPPPQKAKDTPPSKQKETIPPPKQTEAPPQQTKEAPVPDVPEDVKPPVEIKETPPPTKTSKSPSSEKTEESATPEKTKTAPPPKKIETPPPQTKEAVPADKAPKSPTPTQDRPKTTSPPGEAREAKQTKDTKETAPTDEAKITPPKGKVEPPPPGKVKEVKKDATTDKPVKTVEGTQSTSQSDGAKEGVEPEATADPFINAEDQKIIEEITAADKLLQQKKTEMAMRKFENLLQSYPSSPRIRYGRAQAMDRLAEEKRSNELLQSSITAYGEVKDGSNCPPELKVAAVRRQADRMSFLGRTRAASEVLTELSKEFPDNIEITKELGVLLLIMGENAVAQPLFEKAVEADPNDGFSKVHLGFIHRRLENYQEAIGYLEEGIASGEEGTDDGKFFFNLGDSYTRTGRPEEAHRVYEDAASRGLFLSAMQRSLYNVDTLHGQPWWTPKEAKFEAAVKALESNWEVIRDEARALMNKETLLFEAEDESLRHTGDWKQFVLFSRGNKHDDTCKRTPKTCKIIEAIPESAGCKRGQVKFSVMHPGTHVWPHTGPTNCRLRAHLGLVIPGGSRIRVVNETRIWEEGKVFIFDDSFEHEVWQEAESYRMVLIVDLWHPDLTERQRKYLTPI